MTPTFSPKVKELLTQQWLIDRLNQGINSSGQQGIPIAEFESFLAQYGLVDEVVLRELSLDVLQGFLAGGSTDNSVIASKKFIAKALLNQLLSFLGEVTSQTPVQPVVSQPQLLTVVSPKEQFLELPVEGQFQGYGPDFQPNKLQWLQEIYGQLPVCAFHPVTLAFALEPTVQRIASYRSVLGANLSGSPALPPIIEPGSGFPYLFEVVGNFPGALVPVVPYCPAYAAIDGKDCFQFDWSPEGYPQTSTEAILFAATNGLLSDYDLTRRAGVKLLREDFQDVGIIASTWGQTNWGVFIQNPKLPLRAPLSRLQVLQTGAQYEFAPIQGVTTVKPSFPGQAVTVSSVQLPVPVVSPPAFKPYEARMLNGRSMERMEPIGTGVMQGNSVLITISVPGILELRNFMPEYQGNGIKVTGRDAAGAVDSFEKALLSLPNHMDNFLAACAWMAQRNNSVEVISTSGYQPQSFSTEVNSSLVCGGFFRSSEGFLWIMCPGSRNPNKGYFYCGYVLNTYDLSGNLIKAARALLDAPAAKSAPTPWDS